MEGGKKFIMMAFVTDVDQDVTEGSDGIEHMFVEIVFTT